jgi:hypothetical protein
VTLATITLENGEDPAPEMAVRISGVPVRVFYGISGQLENVRTLDDFRALAEAFAPFIESWSYPEPVGVEGLLDRDINDLLAFVRAWQRGVASAPIPLARRSSDGEPSEASAAPSP